MFTRYLPEWSDTGEYNFRASPSTQRAAVQLEQMMHSGSHPWINNRLKFLLEQFNNFSPEVRTERLAQLVNYIHESQNLSNLAAGSKTNGYVAFTSQNDPYWLDFHAKNPQYADITDYHRQHLSWSIIENSPAGQEVANLKIKTVPVDGSNTEFKLSYEGKIDNGGFFSKTSDKLGEFKKPGSSKYSADWAKDNKIAISDDGAIMKNKVAVRIEIANKFVEQKLPDGTLISSHEKIPSKVFSKLGKLGLAGLVASVSVLALSADQAQAQEKYDSAKPETANKSFISELVALVVGELAGLVAGALAGVTSFGLLAIPVAIAVGEVAESFGRYLGGIFYDTFVGSANAAAEYLAPLLSGVGEVVVDVASALFNFVADVFNNVSEFVFGADGLFGLDGPLFGDGGPLQFASAFLQDNSILSNSWTYPEKVEGLSVKLRATGGLHEQRKTQDFYRGIQARSGSFG